jgi:3-methyl-2-oxobutanoate hydroxymethyltransferase
VPVIGIGAGPHTDGQCLVVHDMLGMFEAFTPKFAKKYADIREQTIKALQVFKDEVNKGGFPTPEHCYRMPNEEVEKLEEALRKKR